MTTEVSQVMLKAINNGFEGNNNLQSGINCMTPNDHALELATEIALVLEENKNGPSFFNFMKFAGDLTGLRIARLPVADRIQKEKKTEEEGGFGREYDRDALQTEINAAIDIGFNKIKETSGCYNIRKDVLNVVRQFYSNLLDSKWRSVNPVKVNVGGNKPARKYTDNLRKKKAKKDCANVKGCKVASGSKRTYCRKTKNNTRCVKKSMSKPNTCKKTSRCTVASGSNKTSSRKAHNKTHKKK